MQFTINIHVHHHNDGLTDLRSLIVATTQEIVELITNAEDALTQHIVDAGARVSADIAGLKQEVTDLQARVAAGQSLNPADFQVALDKLATAQADADAIDPTTPPTTPDTGTPTTGTPSPDQPTNNTPEAA
jgi:hypothetical protein